MKAFAELWIINLGTFWCAEFCGYGNPVVIVAIKYVSLLENAKACASREVEIGVRWGPSRNWGVWAAILDSFAVSLCAYATLASSPL